MTTLTQHRGAGCFIASEANGTRSREAITIKSGEGVLYAGTVLGKIAVGAATAAAVAGNTGNGTMGAVTVGAGAKAGVYRLTFIEPGTDAGKFIVEDPDGINIGAGTVAVAYSKAGIAFTLADGATDFASGDSFTITVAAGTGKYVNLDTSATNGSQIAAGILYGTVDATSADTDAVAIVRSAEYNDAEVDFTTTDAGEITTAKAQLAALGVIARTGI